MNVSLRLRLMVMSLLLVIQPLMAQSTKPRQGFDLFANLHGSHRQHRQGDVEAPDAVALGLANAKVYRFSTADFPGSDSSLVADNNLTTAVGYFQFTSKAPLKAFTLSSGVYQILAVPSAVSSAAVGINTGGQIVGYYTDGANMTHGFLDTAGTFSTIDVPGAAKGTAVFDINDSGEMVGYYTDAAEVNHGFTDTWGVIKTIDFPGAAGTYVTGINNLGNVVGAWWDASNTEHAFLLSGGVFTSLDFPTAVGVTGAIGINDSNEISGGYEDAANVGHGFIYSNGAWSEVDVAGASDTSLARIKNNGNINGVYLDDKNEQHAIRGH